MRSLRTSALLAAVLWSGASCTTPVEEVDSTLPGRCQAEVPSIAPQKTDLLFVIDNSASMTEEQAGLSTELPAFLAELQRGDAVTQDFRVGVITTSVYQRVLFNDGTERLTIYNDQAGRLQPVPDAKGQPTAERYLDGRDADLLAKFRRLVRQGIRGSGQETPFEAVRLALTPPLSVTPLEQGGNGGFLREGARLLVVVVSDEDDCSSTERPPPVALTEKPEEDSCHEQAGRLTPVSEYARLLRGLPDGARATREVLWAAIGPVGVTNKQVGTVYDSTSGVTVIRNVDCPTSYAAGYRQREMALLFDTRLANLDSICRANYRDTLVSIAALARSSQSIEVMNLPDARLAQVRVTREDGSVQTCSVVGGDLTYAPPVEGRAARLYFQSSCPRRLTDTRLEVSLLCAQ